MVKNFNPENRNILNGGAMFQYLQNSGVDVSNAVPFNEAMCMGEHTYDVFSDKFIDTRCESLEIRRVSYMDEVCFPLISLLGSSEKELDLWFDEDMFCQINLLVLLTYLEQIGFNKPIHLNLVSPKYEFLKRVDISLGDFQNIYNKVMISYELPEKVEIESLEKGVNLYLDYIKPENELTDFILENMHQDRALLIEKMLNKFKEYGLGDLQVIKLIDQVK